MLPTEWRECLCAHSAMECFIVSRRLIGAFCKLKLFEKLMVKLFYHLSLRGKCCRICPRMRATVKQYSDSRCLKKIFKTETTRKTDEQWSAETNTRVTILVKGLSSTIIFHSVCSTAGLLCLAQALPLHGRWSMLKMIWREGGMGGGCVPTLLTRLVKHPHPNMIDREGSLYSRVKAGLAPLLYMRWPVRVGLLLYVPLIVESVWNTIPQLVFQN